MTGGYGNYLCIDIVFFTILLVALLIPPTGCRRPAGGTRPMLPADSVPARPGRIPLTIGSARLWAEVADRPELDRPA